MNTTSISRRRFTQYLGLGAAAALVRPPLAFAREPVATPAAIASSPAADAIVRLSSNENPYGPSPRALKAMQEAFELAWRYPDEQNDALIDSLAKLHGVAHDQILLGDGSSEILQLCASTFTGPDRKLVVADPTFEAIANLAKSGGAEVVKVPLTSSFAHDLAKMSGAGQSGLVYICNPNNPTASLTPKQEVRASIEKSPRETAVLVDEAYFHFADSADYESVIPLIKDHANLVVARTFSKIYGMAGLRCGYCVAQKETIARMRTHQMWDSVNCIALAAALASIDDEEETQKRRRLTSEAKSFTTTELEKLGYNSIPSQANFIMFDVKRPVVPLIKALKDRRVAVGRLFPAMPNHLRLTIGKQSEMEAFLGAFRAVTA
ncbi:MAG: histidinol-phosphate transaminase [Verrucomicrobiota bacterium]|nr:histidinol-phosphate transaminase [Verrucomicrobiota bacterium]